MAHDPSTEQKIKEMELCDDKTLFASQRLLSVMAAD